MYVLFVWAVDVFNCFCYHFYVFVLFFLFIEVADLEPASSSPVLALLRLTVIWKNRRADLRSVVNTVIVMSAEVSGNLERGPSLNTDRRRCVQACENKH